ncbi:MAG: pro-sigmaK processing inhibitor BofA family protein [Candidatus Hydrothermarchaeota archaeon]|nr:pro-sigmaK processing inhibitor BofA family protein [Candidatus Hydrothermarchaeota archaeon]
MDFEILVSIAIALGVLYIFYRVMKKLIYNTVVGLVLLLILNYTILSGNPVPLKVWTITTVAIFGILGAIVLAVGKYFGII